MNLSRCEKGHFYDKEKFSSCPHCANGGGSDESLTTVFTENVTEPASPVDMSGSAGTVSADMDLPIAGAAPGAPIPFQEVTEGVMNPGMMPVADIPAGQVTEAMNMGGLDSATVPLTNFAMEDNVTEAMDQDDDHTVGFFDDDFFGAPGAAPSTAAPQKKAGERVSTPCVGWLIAIGGRHIGTDFRLKVGKNFIGRAPSMDVALTEDKSVSREKHAIVVYEPKTHMYLVQPGESSSLVYLNNEVVLTPVKLSAYDMITVGDVNLLFMPLCGERFNWSTLFDEMKQRQ